MRSGQRLGLAFAILAAMSGPLAARSHRGERPSAATSAPPPQPVPPPATPAPPTDSRPYDPQLQRLAELLGALTTMRQLCGEADADLWRRRMQVLLDAEGNPSARRDRLAGAFNRGLHGYALTYRTCTANARLVIERALDESGRLARDLGTRYGAS